MFTSLAKNLKYELWSAMYMAEKRTYILSITWKTRKIIITLLHTHLFKFYSFFSCSQAHIDAIQFSSRTYFYLFHSLPHFLALLPFSNFFLLFRDNSVLALHQLCVISFRIREIIFIGPIFSNSFPPFNFCSLNIFSRYNFLCKH